MSEGDDVETVFLVNGIGIALSPSQMRGAARAADRRDGIAHARDFRRRMIEAYAAAEYPVEQRRVRRGV